MAETALAQHHKSTNGRSFYWYLAPLRGFFGLLGSLAPKLAARLAFVLFRFPRRHATPTRERLWLASAERFEVEVDGQRLVAWSWGVGPTVLLAHGWEGRGSQMGAFAQPLVEAGFRVVTFDGPGHGLSGGRLSSLPQFAAAVEALAEYCGPLHAVVAHSFGCPATAWAARGGLEAQRFVFVAPPADLDDYIRFFADLIGMSPRVRRNMISRLEQQFDVKWEEARVATLHPATRSDLMVIHDRDDKETPIDHGVSVATAWPAGRLVSTKGLGHRRILRHPAVVSEVVAFISASPSDIESPGTDCTERPVPRLSAA